MTDVDDLGNRILALAQHLRGGEDDAGYVLGELTAAVRQALTSRDAELARLRSRNAQLFDQNQAIAESVAGLQAELREARSAQTEIAAMRALLSECVRRYDYWADPSHDDETDAAQMGASIERARAHLLREGDGK